MKRMMAIIKLFVLIIIIGIGLTSCTPVFGITSDNQISEPWLYADLRQLDGIDAPSPDSDLLAAYSRFSRQDLQIRLDFLSLNDLGNYPVNIYINSKPGGILIDNSPSSILWDWKIEIGTNGFPRFIDAGTGTVLVTDLKLNVMKQLDFLEIFIPLEYLDSNNNNMQIFVTVQNTAAIVLDQLGPFSTQQLSSPNPAPLLITFWDVFKGDTPAQALRSWNGAHTGPFGTRHGLSHLLSAVEEFAIPVVLLDLKEPSHLYALNYLDSIDTIKRLGSGGLLMLPELAYGKNHALDKILDVNSNYSKKFGLYNRYLIYGTYPLADIPPDSIAFSTTPSTHNIYDIGNGTRLIPLPSSYLENSTPITNQIGISGNRFPLDLKQNLIDVALSSNKGDLVTIGESLQDSALGDPSISADFFLYIQSHPWIRPLNQNDLLNFPAQSSSFPLLSDCKNILCNPDPPDFVPYSVFGNETPAGFTYPDLIDRVTAEILTLPDNNISESALLVYQQYLNPRTKKQFQGLQANYIGQIGHLIQAALWLESPVQIQECFDLDWDGLPECVLANEKIFSSFEIEGGRLLFLFIKNECGLIPVIAPFSQYTVGLSDNTLWNLENGYLADPQEISGFLADNMDQIGNYKVELQEGKLIFSDPSKEIEKSFILSENALTVTVSYLNPARISIPVPAGLNSDYSSGSNSIIIRGNYGRETLINLEKFTEGRDCVRIFIPGRNVQKISPFESIALLKLPEDPNIAYKPGDYLPFPFQLFHFEMDVPQTVKFISEN